MRIKLKRETEHANHEKTETAKGVEHNEQKYNTGISENTCSR